MRIVHYTLQVGVHVQLHVHVTNAEKLTYSLFDGIIQLQLQRGVVSNKRPTDIPASLLQQLYPLTVGLVAIGNQVKQLHQKEKSIKSVQYIRSSKLKEQSSPFPNAHPIHTHVAVGYATYSQQPSTVRIHIQIVYTCMHLPGTWGP